MFDHGNADFWKLVQELFWIPPPPIHTCVYVYKCEFKACILFCIQMIQQSQWLQNGEYITLYYNCICHISIIMLSFFQSTILFYLLLSICLWLPVKQIFSFNFLHLQNYFIFSSTKFFSPYRQHLHLFPHGFIHILLMNLSIYNHIPTLSMHTDAHYEQTLIFAYTLPKKSLTFTYSIHLHTHTYTIIINTHMHMHYQYTTNKHTFTGKHYPDTCNQRLSFHQ